MPETQVIFLIVSALTLAAGVAVVTLRNLFHAALMLMVCLFGVAGFYILLEAPFLAAAQVLIYIGAIAILIMFAVMLTRRVMNPVQEPRNAEWPIGLVVAALMFVVLALVVIARQSWPSSPPGTDLSGSIATLGKGLLQPDQYALPFEVASVMLLAALIGSIVIARENR